LLDTVAAAGAVEDTIVVFTSDHGDMMESQGLSYKLYPWEESIRIPLLVRYPRKYGRKGRRSSAPVNSPDLMPTLLGMSGIAVPSGVQGTDYSSLGSKKTSAFLNLPVPIGEALRYGFAEYRGVRTARHTYVRSIDGPWLLYDNERDPYQMHNLCGQSGARDLLASLNRDLDSWLETLNDQFLPARNYLERDGLSHYLETKFPIGSVRSPWGDWQSTLRRPAGPASSVNTAVGELLEDSASNAILTRELPELARKAATSERLRTLSLWLIQQLRMSPISDATLASIDKQLADLPPK
jgi:hypothetical protein